MTVLAAPSWAAPIAVGNLSLQPSLNEDGEVEWIFIQLWNFTGADYAFPPDYPVLTELGFNLAAVNSLTTDEAAREYVFDLPIFAGPVDSPSPDFYFVPDAVFESIDFVASVSPGSFMVLLPDGSEQEYSIAADALARASLLPLNCDPLGWVGCSADIVIDADPSAGVPEPGSAVLLLSALLVSAAAKPRKRKRE